VRIFWAVPVFLFSLNVLASSNKCDEVIKNKMKMLAATGRQQESEPKVLYRSYAPGMKDNVYYVIESASVNGRHHSYLSALVRVADCHVKETRDEDGNIMNFEWWTVVAP